MNVISWLKKQDPTIEYLTNHYLLNQNDIQNNQGLIKKYLDLFDPSKNTWGNGYYGPKWISTHYTMLELRYLEITFDHPIYQAGIETLMKHLWKNKGMYNKVRKVDLCIAGMLLTLSCYGKSRNPKIDEIIDYILMHQYKDGGWNCMWDSGKNPNISSMHTTMNILEGLRDYLDYGYQYRKDEVSQVIHQATELLLSRALFKSFSNEKPIHEDMIKPHFPYRWKYDILRALEFMDSIHHPYDLRMKDGLLILKHQLKGPFMQKGTTISGLTHFKLEKGKYGAFNTFRVLKVFKRYLSDEYLNLIQIEIKE
jgi:hypothetical protein